MASVTILGKEIQLEFRDDCDDAVTVSSTSVALAKMVDLINNSSWDDSQAAAFRMMDKIVCFRGEVTVNGWRMSRPCCDEAQRTFYWSVGEFQQNSDADVHGNTFFHDCWHVVQYRQAGDKYPANNDERVEREVDAINHQIDVAIRLGCDDREVSYLRGFRDSQQRIIARLDDGVQRGGTQTA